jgi:hypothetical protein
MPETGIPAGIAAGMIILFSQSSAFCTKSVFTYSGDCCAFPPAILRIRLSWGIMFLYDSPFFKKA